MKPKIALIVDTDNWAFYNEASVLKEKLSEYYDFKIIPATSALDDNVLQTILLVQDCQLVHFYWRGLLFSLDNENIVFKRNNIDVNEFIKEKCSNIIKTTCIPDHSLLDEKHINKTANVLNFVDAYYTISGKLFDIYSKMNFKKPEREIISGVKAEYFIPENLERFNINNIKNRKVVIGWSGNSKWGEWENSKDIKGLRTIIKPAIEELINEGYDIELKLADKAEKFTPITEMKDFYNSIDIYICASETEGGPNPVLESMRCGVPIISTDVGFVKEVLGEKQQQFIIQKRTIKNLQEKIKYLIQNREKLKELSDENLKESVKHTYDVVAMQFKEFFDKNLKKKINTKMCDNEELMKELKQEEINKLEKDIKNLKIRNEGTLLEYQYVNNLKEQRITILKQDNINLIQQTKERNKNLEKCIEEKEKYRVKLEKIENSRWWKLRNIIKMERKKNE